MAASHIERFDEIAATLHRIDQVLAQPAPVTVSCVIKFSLREELVGHGVSRRMEALYSAGAREALAKLRPALVQEMIEVEAQAEAELESLRARRIAAASRYGVEVK